MKQITIKLSDYQLKGLKELSTKTKLPRAELIRRAIDLQYKLDKKINE